MGRLLRMGIADCLADYGLPTPNLLKREELTETLISNIPQDQEEIGRQLFHQLWKLFRPDGVIAGTDLMAVGAVRAMKELGLSPGKDVQVVALCNKEIDYPELSEVKRFNVCIEDVARALVKLAVERIRHPQNQPSDISIPFQCAARN